LDEVEMEVAMPDDWIIGRHSHPWPSPVATSGEAPRAAASFNHRVLRTAV